MTQDDLAKIVGTRRETILAIENCKYFPSVKLAHDIAKVLKTTIDEMYVFDE
jgi:putative transcriptional regulator